MKNFVIRSATPKDIPFIVQANAIINQESGLDPIDPVKTAKRYKADLFGKYPKAFVLIAETDGVKTGLAMYGLTYFARLADVMYISQIYTDPKYARQGIASALLNELLLIARENNYSYVYCFIDHDNKASRKLAEKFGIEKSDHMDVFRLYRK
ncbi:MAG: GNAT family N-acetyltransferase [Lactobacillales bacterium]|jgi:L-amino acid N-acyltransferase YncA|nr:GNAT family N-acetyltransferase [Lactobacillales bacterium]